LPGTPGPQGRSQPRLHQKTRDAAFLPGASCRSQLPSFREKSCDRGPTDAIRREVRNRSLRPIQRGRQGQGRFPRREGTANRPLLDETTRILAKALLADLLAPPFYCSASPRQRPTYLLHTVLTRTWLLPADLTRC